MSAFRKYRSPVQSIFYTLLLLLSFLFGCKNLPVVTSRETPTDILQDFMSFWLYWNHNVKLSRNYIAYDDHNKQMDKLSFVDSLITGKYLPLRIGSEDSLTYCLYPFSDTTNSRISHTISQYGGYFHKYYLMEGKPAPDFHFVDLNGVVYDPSICKGKIMVLNCWFTKCGACIAEMPQLNQLVNTYKNRKDILFVSLAMDSARKVKDFLSKTRFDYAAVPATESYQEDSLHIFMWPTQIIINKKGIISRMMNDYADLATVLKKEASY